MRSKRYDASFGFRLMEALRNAVQHRSLSAIQVTRHYGTDHRNNDSGEVAPPGAARFLVTRVMLTLSISEIHDMELKASVRKEIEAIGGNDIDLTIHVREYIDGLAAMHYEFRRVAQTHRHEWESIIRQALTSGRERWPNGKSSALSLVAVNPSGEVVEWSHLFSGFIDYLTALEAKNEGPLQLSRTYVSGNSRRD
jgi:hypothetical protein